MVSEEWMRVTKGEGECEGGSFIIGGPGAQKYDGPQRTATRVILICIFLCVYAIYIYIYLSHICPLPLPVSGFGPIRMDFLDQLWTHFGV